MASAGGNLAALHLLLVGVEAKGATGPSGEPLLISVLKNAPVFSKEPRQIKSGKNFTPATSKPSLSQEAYAAVLNALLDAGVDGGGEGGWEGTHAVEMAAEKGYMGVCAR